MRGRTIRWALPALLVAVAGAGGALAATSSMHGGTATVRAVKSASFGSILVGPNGKTLYRFTVDRKHVNRCSSNATCNKFWPALLVKPGVKPSVGGGASASLVGTIAAKHGLRQVTYAGWPLYYFAGDKAKGQTNGQGVQAKWYVVNTAGSLVRHAVKAAAPAPAATTTSGNYGGGSAWG